MPPVLATADAGQQGAAQAALRHRSAPPVLIVATRLVRVIRSNKRPPSGGPFQASTGTRRPSDAPDAPLPRSRRPGPRGLPASPTSAAVTRGRCGSGPWGWQDYPLPGKTPTVYRTQRSGDRRRGCASRPRRACSAVQLRVRPAQLARVQFSWRVATLIAGADLAEADTSDSMVRIVLWPSTGITAGCRCATACCST